MKLYDRSLSLKATCLVFSVNILQTHQSVQMEKKAHHNEITWTAQPNTPKSFSFKFTGIVLWQSISTFHDKINFSHIFVNIFSLVPVTLYIIACNKLKAQRPKQSRATTAPLSPGTAAPPSGSCSHPTQTPELQEHTRISVAHSCQHQSRTTN